MLDKSTPYVLYRWIGTGSFLVLFFIRIFVAQGWYIGTTIFPFSPLLPLYHVFPTGPADR